MYMRNIRQQPQNKIQRFILPFLCCVLVASPALQALTSDIKKPVKIDASSVTFNKEKGYAVYEGGVSIQQGTLKITASKIEIFAPKNNISRIVASGSPVKFEQKMDDGKWAKGTASSVRYLINEKKIILAGNATLSQDKDTFSSPYIQYSTRTGELKAGNTQKGSKSAGRVKAIFYPAQ